MWNSCMKCWTWPYGAKSRPSSPIHQVWSLLIWDIMQHWVVIPYQTFGTTCWSHIQGSEIQRRKQKMTEINWQNLLFWYLPIVYLFKEAWYFRSWIYFCFQAMKHLTWWTSVIELCSITWPHRNINLLGYAPENRSSPM